MRLLDATILQKEILSKKAILIAYAAVFLCLVVGIRFTSPLLNHLAFVFLVSFLWFLPYLIFTLKPKHVGWQIAKITAGIFSVLIAVAAILPLLFVFLNIYSIATDWDGKDLSKLEIHRTPIRGWTDVVVYQTNGGATTDFGTVFYKETALIPNFLKRVKNIDGIYHTRDLMIEKVDDNTIRIKEIDFTGTEYKNEYYGDGGTLKEGDEIAI